MKNKMPLDGLGLGHDSGSVHCDMLKMLCFRTAWGALFFTLQNYKIFFILPNIFSTFFVYPERFNISSVRR